MSKPDYDPKQWFECRKCGAQAVHWYLFHLDRGYACHACGSIDLKPMKPETAKMLEPKP